MLSQMNFTTEQHIIIVIGTLFVFAIWYIVNDYYKVEGFISDARDDTEKKIDNNDWTFFDKMMYGGLGYGNICLPTHLFKVILIIIFPPLGIVIKYIHLIDNFPWIDITDFVLNIGEFIQSIVLTAFFYIPGLIYSLNQLKCSGDSNCA